MTAAKKVKLAALKLQLKRSVAASRRDHGVWMKYRNSGDHRRGHGAMVVWQKQVKKSASISASIQALQQQLQKSATTASEAVAKAIGSWEGGKGSDGRFHPYWDEFGKVWTIGYGHTNFDSGLRVSASTKPLTAAEAVSLLLHDLSTNYAPSVASYFKRYGWKNVTQKQFDACVSFAYNNGSGDFETSHTLGNAMHARDGAGMANAFLLYDHSGGVRLAGLTRRRRWERQLFLGGTYNVS